MIKRLLLAGLLVMGLAALIVPAAAQGNPPEPARITLEGADGQTLVGAFYAPPGDSGEDGGSPGVLLMHQMGMDKDAWPELAAALVEAEYAVLSVDLRGHGETGGSRLWNLAEVDVQRWLDWLRAQPGVDPDRMNIVGASIGANLALRGMANDAGVITTVALSPGLEYSGVTTADAVTAIGDRPLGLVAGRGDVYSADSLRDLLALAEGDTLLRLYDNQLHGNRIFPVEADLAPSIVFWLESHNR